MVQPHLETNMIRFGLIIAVLSISASIFAQTPASLSPSDSHQTTSAAEQLVERFQLREGITASNRHPQWKTPKKVVFWGSDQQVAPLKQQFPQLDIIATNEIATAKNALETADVFIGYCIPALLQEKTKVRWIQSMGVGVEGCANSQPLKENKVLVTNTQRLSSPEIAEHSIAMMFALVRQLDLYGKSQAESKWDRSIAPDPNEIWEIEGRTMLVVGLGGIGTETARRAHGLGMKVIATRNSRRSGPDYVSYVGLSNELLDLAKQADVIVNTAPLTTKTLGMYDKDFFEAMKPNAYFISIGRGKSVVTDDLVAALKAGQLAGAGLDVTDPEPLPKDHPLWTTPRVIITPHMAYRSEKLRPRVMVLVEENLRRYIRGQKMLSVVDLERGY
jgi:phosphoglycerate dehydrogenase-like enzyme